MQKKSEKIHPRIIIICGLPGAGKTTLAKRIEAEIPSFRMSADDWMDALDINLWDEGMRDKIETLQWNLTKKMLGLGITVIIEWGTWSCAERDKLRLYARSMGVAVELHYLEVSLDVLLERLQKRNRENPPIQRGELEKWSEWIEVPTPEELQLFDAPSFQGGD